MDYIYAFLVLVVCYFVLTVLSLVFKGLWKRFELSLEDSLNRKRRSLAIPRHVRTSWATNLAHHVLGADANPESLEKLESKLMLLSAMSVGDVLRAINSAKAEIQLGDR